MAIRRAQWNHHASLGDLTLDFTNKDGRAFHTVVIAGENGTGKTTVLESISKLGQQGPPYLHDFASVEIDESGIGFARISRHDGNSIDMAAALFDDDGNDITLDRTESRRPNDIAINSLSGFQRRGIAYSKARSGFQTKPISSVTTGELPRAQSLLDESDDYTQVKQMLVNLHAQDNREFAQLGKQRGEVSWPLFYPTSKMYRFAAAFDSFFDDLTFDRVDEINSVHQVMFKKHGREIPIDSLSTGEKQIVYRGAYLLGGLRNNEAGVVLVDEPELSMHPKWQQKILAYYRDLFPLDSNNPVQLIIATHSEYVLEAALNDPDDTLVITLEDKDGVIVPNRITRPYALRALSASEIKYRVFGVASTDYHVALYGLLQSLAGDEKVRTCDRFIEIQPEYDAPRHERIKTHRSTEYRTLPTFIRNAIGHPEPGNMYSMAELVASIELMQAIALRLK